MATDMASVDMLTGGCQCGAVRYRLEAMPASASLCHCRMCQKATGGPFLASATLPAAAVVWTRGTPATFLSSTIAERTFCAACGTPLTFRTLGADEISVSLGSLDQPDRVAPNRHIGVEARVAWWGSVAGLPSLTTEEDAPGFAARVVSRQHPDHDTGAEWRPK